MSATPRLRKSEEKLLFQNIEKNDENFKLKSKKKRDRHQISLSFRLKIHINDKTDFDFGSKNYGLHDSKSRLRLHTPGRMFDLMRSSPLHVAIPPFQRHFQHIGLD